MALSLLNNVINPYPGETVLYYYVSIFIPEYYRKLLQHKLNYKVYQLLKDNEPHRINYLFDRIIVIRHKTYRGVVLFKPTK